MLPLPLRLPRSRTPLSCFKRHIIRFPSGCNLCTHPILINFWLYYVVTLCQPLDLPLRDSCVSARTLQHMALDSETGLDPEGVALRATEGLFGVDYFFPVRLPPP